MCIPVPPCGPTTEHSIAEAGLSRIWNNPKGSWPAATNRWERVSSDSLRQRMGGNTCFTQGSVGRPNSRPPRAPVPVYSAASIQEYSARRAHGAATVRELPMSGISAHERYLVEVPSVPVIATSAIENRIRVLQETVLRGVDTAGTRRDNRLV